MIREGKIDFLTLVLMSGFVSGTNRLILYCPGKQVFQVKD